MTKHIYQIAEYLQEQLLGLRGLYPANEWAKHAPRVQLDAWAALEAWNRARQPVVRISDEQAEAILSNPLDPALELATAKVQHEAVACQLPDRKSWVVLARTPPMSRVVVFERHEWYYPAPMLTYCMSSLQGSDNGLASGYFNLRDQPKMGDLTLCQGTETYIKTEEQRPSRSDLQEEKHRLLLALGIFFR